MSRDPFATADLRSAVLDDWRRSPARLREDANTEEDHARGYYRDRVVVELAQNAADAAARAGVPGRLLLRLTSLDGRPVLLAANTGAPLDAAGAAALATMRASAKRGSPGLVGRFGVGFAAVRAVSDEILAASAGGAVRFSLDRTRGLIGAEPVLEAEAGRRGDSLPVLRVPFPADDVPDIVGRALADFDTVILLELRDDAAARSVRSLLGVVGDPFLLALPALAEITVETPDGAFTVADVEERWHVARAEGTAPRELLADRPTEERSSSAWRLAWALPREGVQREGVVLAPTPTLEVLTLPALLIGTFPLDPTRRHIATGPLTDELVRAAGALYGELGGVLARAGRDPLDLVPLTPPGGELDSSVRDAALEGLAVAAVLRVGAPTRGPAVRLDSGVELSGAAPQGADGWVAPRDATALAGEVGRDAVVVGALTRAAANLVVLGPGQERRAAVLGVQIRDVGDVVDELAALPAPADWHELYAALAPAAADPGVRESLGAMGVPLADGRTVRGARGTVALRGAPEVLTAAAALAPWGLRIVHPEAEHPLLERLGAEVGDAATVLTHDAVRAAVAVAREDEDVAAQLASAILTLAAAAEDLPPWIGEVPLPEDGGGLAPARELVVAGSLAEELFDPDVVGVLDPEVLERWPDVVRLGVLTGLPVSTMRDVATGPALLDDDVPPPAAWHDYLAELTDQLGPDVTLGDMDVVLDLDAVRDEAWPEVLRLLDTDPVAHRAVARTVQGRPSYTAWWLRHDAPEHLGLGAPFALGPELEPLLGPVPTALAGRSEAFLVALGGVHRLTELDARDWADVDLGEEGEDVDPVTARAVWDALASVAAAHEPHLPELLPAVVAPDRIVLAPTDDVVVVPGPHWFARTDVGPMLPGPREPHRREAWAESLGLAAAPADDDVQVTSRGVVADVPGAVADVLPGAAAQWTEHEDLRVDEVPVPWWPPAHAVHLAGLARALAWSSGHWDRRGVVELTLADTDRARELAVELAAAQPAAEEDTAP